MPRLDCIRCEGTGWYFVLIGDAGPGDDPVWTAAQCDCPPLAEITATGTRDTGQRAT